MAEALGVEGVLSGLMKSFDNRSARSFPEVICGLSIEASSLVIPNGSDY
jgi:hypothetical protein